MAATTEVKQVWRAARSILYPALDFGTKANGTYPSEDFARILTRSAFEREFTNTSGKHLQLARGEGIGLEQRSPLAKSLLYNVGQLTADAIAAQFDGVRDQILTHARRARAFPDTAELAGDIHEWLYYGSEDTPKICRINPERGTNLAYIFVTVCIVSPAKRFTLATSHIAGLDTPTVIAGLREVIETASRAVSITRIYCDRCFNRVELVNELCEMDVEFVMRAPKSPGIKRELGVYDKDTFVTEYELVRKRGSRVRVPVTLVVVPRLVRDDDSLCLITNRSVAVDEAQPLAEAYRRRWGIETSYRKIGEFLPRTTSPVFAVRLFYFRFAVALYNLWVLASLLLTAPHQMTRRPVVSSATFRFFLGPVTYG